MIPVPGIRGTLSRPGYIEDDDSVDIVCVPYESGQDVTAWDLVSMRVMTAPVIAFTTVHIGPSNCGT